MQTMLLGLAAASAIVLTSTPAQAEHWSDSSFAAAASVAVHRGPLVGITSNAVPRHPRARPDGNHHGRRDRDRGNDLSGWGYAYYPADFDGNRAFDPDKYNDWWHDRPERSIPRWVQSNQNCERQYWTGAGWRC